MKVSFFQRARKIARLSGAGVAMLLLASAAQAATPGWNVRMVDIDGIVDTTTKAEQVGYNFDLSNTGGTIVSNTTGIYDVIDFEGGGGSFTGQGSAYPNGASGTGAGNDFVVAAAANVTIPVGTWSVAFGSDDGGAVTINGINFTSTFGQNGAQGVPGQIRFEAPRGHSWTGGSFTVAGAPKSTTMTAIMYERGGGDSFEVAVAAGPQGGFDAATWELLGNGSQGWTVTAGTFPAPRIPVRGENVVGAQALAPTALETTLAPAAGATQPGLTQRWYAANSGTAGQIVNLQLSGTPVVPAFRGTSGSSQWWWGSDATQPANMVRYPDEIEAASPFSQDGDTSFQNYTAILTGEILFPAAGVYKFKDGVDDWTGLKIDVNGNGTFEASENLIGDNTWTNVAGDANGGSPIVSVTVPAEMAGKWAAIEFSASEGGGGDAGVLAWDYDATTGIGGGVAKGFPTANNQPFGAEAGLTPAEALENIAVPNSNLRTSGVRAITGGAGVAKLGTLAPYEFEIASKSFSDRFTVSSSGLPAGWGTKLDATGATFNIVTVGDLKNGESVKLVEAGSIVGSPTITWPAGVVFDTTNFATTGEVKLVSGGGSGGGNPFDQEPDGDVDSDDLLGFLAAWTGSNAAGNAEDGDNPNLVYDPRDGNVTLVPGKGARGKIVGFVLINNSDAFKPASDADFLAATPWGEAPIEDPETGEIVGYVMDNKSKQIGSADTTFAGTRKEIALGKIFPTGLNLAGLQNMLTKADVTWALGAAGKGQLDLVVLPEPGSLALLGLGLLGVTNVVRRRRK